jgi:hypothetical protein
MAKPEPSTQDLTNAWNPYEKIVFRFFFIYFILQAFPLDWKYYRSIFSIDWNHLNYGDIFSLARYAPSFFGPEQIYADWGILAGLALAGTVLWTALERGKRFDYDTLYYYLRVVVRYRLALGIIAYGLIKVFPIQAPYPSLSNLNTNYGDFNAWKLFSLSLGIVPDFQSFLGVVETFAGLLLLFRKTASIGAFVIIAFTGNVVLSNLAYEGGEYIYSFYLVALAIFILAFDIPRLIRLLTLEKPTFPNRFKPVFQGWQRNTRLALKGTFIFFFIFFYGIKVYNGYQAGLTKFPKTPGLADAAGLYDVAVFKINADTLAYSATDPRRWKDVVFESWNTVSVRSNRSVQPDLTNVEYVAVSDEDRGYELEGSGSRHYFSYAIDAQKQTLSLQNRNSNYAGEQLTLHYTRPDDKTLTLSGIDENRDSVFVVLKKIDKKYLLQEAVKTGRRGGLKL